MDGWTSSRRSRGAKKITTRIAYGKGFLNFEHPQNAEVTVLEPRFLSAADDQTDAINAALADPIGMAPMAETLRPTDRVGIVFSDITRATPYELLIPPLLNQLTALPDERITFFNATGTHRSNTREELITILGSEVVNRFRILQNDCTDTASHRFVGSTPSGNRISILSEFLDCEVKVLTGFIEPHFFAGMSGGGKAIMPGLALLETILCNHSASHMDHPQVRWGATEGNPLWEEVRDAALLAGESFILNVALNTLKEITAVFAGAFPDAHRAGCAYVREHAMAPVESEFDIVVTSNSGYPLDLNMYQAVKGMSAARQIVSRGGHIVVAADCWDGIPDHGDYGRLLTNASTPANLLETVRTPGFACQDQWQAQIHAAICEQTTVHFYSDHLTEEQITGAFMEPTHDISVTVTELVASGRGSRICVLPFGPLTIPYVARDDTGLEMISDDRSSE